MASALLVSLVLMAGDPPAPAGTLACNPPDGPLAEQVCLSERLLDRDRRVAEGLIALSRASLPEAALAGIGQEANRLRIRRDACLRRATPQDGREACLIFAYDRWLERIAEWQQTAQAASGPQLTDPATPPDLAAR